MQSSLSFTTSDITHISELALIPVTEEEKTRLADGFNTVIKVLDSLNQIDVSGIEPTHHVTGLENITREDIVDEARMFTQKEALQNAPVSYDGFFLVSRVLDK
jgi:aspartyl-tRNA(Asn)/glutamyl-tRNA(Gln) amidotransferase subunit C